MKEYWKPINRTKFICDITTILMSVLETGIKFLHNLKYTVNPFLI